MSRKANNLRKRLAIEKAQNAKLRRKADGHVRLQIGRVTELTIVDHKAVEHVVGGAYLSSCQFGLTGGGSRLKLIAEFTT